MKKVRISLFALILALFFVISQSQQGFSLESPAPKPALPLLKPQILPEVKEKPQSTGTLSNHIKSYQQPYLSVYMAALSALSNNLTIVSYDSAKGVIKARARGGEELFILVASFQNNLTKVRITPADGIYDIPLDVINGIFEGIKVELAHK